MIAKKFFIYLLIILLTIYPASAGAGEVSLNRWVLNVTLDDNGLVEEVIQAEIENSGTLPLDGLSLVVPASGVKMMDDQFVSIPATGQVVEQQTVPGGIKIFINFNKSVEIGKKWNGRFGFIVENWARKEGSNYSIDIPVEAPQAIVSGKSIKMSVQADADIRSQVFLPKSVEVTYVKPEPFRILFQYDHMVPTWSPDKLHIGDTISIKGSSSNILTKIIETDEKIRSLSARIKEAKAQGKDVAEAETHLASATDYNTNQALASFWKKENSVALEYVGYANDELSQSEDSLSRAVQPKESTGTTGTPTNQKTPGFEAIFMISILLITFLLKRYAMFK